MCGITGILDKNLAKKELIERMTRCIAHRGPDDEGYFVDSKIALGMRRLSIIDLEKGSQPITSPDGRYMIFYNGEVYNYREVKEELKEYKFKTESDTEVILAGFIKWGANEMLSRLRGMFAFAIYDEVEKKILVARDQFGIKPLYYWKKGEEIVAFSSEIKSFFSLPEFKPVVNDATVYNYLSYQYNPLRETFFKGVYKLLPGHYISADLKSGLWQEKRYWKFEFHQNNNLKVLL